MIKTAIGRVAKVGVSPEMLLVRAKLLRMLGLIPKQQATKTGQVDRILFSFPYHQLGDVILALTLLDRVYEIWPNSEIDIAIGSAFAPLVEQISYVGRVFSIVRPPGSMVGFGVYREFSNLTKSFREQIASRDYDLTISPRWNSLDSYFGAYLAYLTGAPVRCGYTGDNDGVRPGVDRLYTVIARGGAFEHESLRYTRLLGRCGFEEEAAVSEEISQHRIRSLWDIAQRRRPSAEQITKGAYAVISPGASLPNRRWPVESFAAVGRHLQKKFGLQIVVSGGSSEFEMCQSLCHLIGYGAISLAGKTEILKLVDVVAGAEIFIGNDSGTSHIAGGLGLKTVVVNGFPADCMEDSQHSPVRFRPVGPAVRVVQYKKNLPPCDGMCKMNWPHCIQQVKAESVNLAVDVLMAVDGITGN